MKDSEYSELKLKASITPQQLNWPEPKFHHWQRLHEAVTEARARVGKLYAAADAIESDKLLSDEGKKSARAKIAEQAITEAKASKALDNARTAVSNQLQRWAAKIDEHIKPAEDLHSTTVHAQIRDRVANMSREDRLTFFQKHAGDPLVASALLTAPAFLSGLTEPEAAMIRTRVEKNVMTSKIIQARADTERALIDAERGWARAIALISERGGLDKIERGKAA